MQIITKQERETSIVRDAAEGLKHDAYLECAQNICSKHMFKDGIHPSYHINRFVLAHV